MGMHSYVEFLRSKDNDHYKRMLKIKHACDEAGCRYPEEVDEYFGGEGDEYPLQIQCRVATEYRDDMLEGFEVAVKDIPKGVDVIRFVNSY